MLTKSERFYLTWRDNKDIKVVAGHMLRDAYHHKGLAAIKLLEYFRATDFRPKDRTLRGCQLLVGAHFQTRRTLDYQYPPPLLPAQQQVRWYVPQQQYVYNGAI